MKILLLLGQKVADAWVLVYLWIMAIPKVLTFYKGSPLVAAQEIFGIFLREGWGGIHQRAQVMFGSLRKPLKIKGRSSLFLYGGIPEKSADFLPKVSVVVPNFNHGRFLKDRLDSIYGQTYGNFEVILLDDCSIDNSRDILREYSAKYPDRTFELFNEENSGCIFKQWNRGISAASGDIVWIAESDDYCSSNFLEDLVRFFINPAVKLAFSRSDFVRSDDGASVWTSEQYLSDINMADWGQPFVRSAHDLVMSGWSVKNVIPNVSSALFRRPVALKILDDPIWLNMRLCGDWVFYLSIIRGGLVGYSPLSVNKYRQHEKNTSRTIQKQEMYYREHGIVVSYLRSLYRVEKKTLQRHEDYLYKHWCMARGSGLREEFESVHGDFAANTAFEPRKPTIVLAAYAMAAGGGETFPIFLANQLFARGYSVTFLDCAQEPAEKGVLDLLEEDIPLLRLNRMEVLPQVLLDMGVELIHSHHAWVDVSVATLLDGCNDVLHVVSMHGMYEMMSEAHFGMIYPLLRREVSEWVFTTDKNIAHFPPDLLEEGRLRKINNALPRQEINSIAREDLNIDKDDFVLCMVSRAIPQKGWEEAVCSVLEANKFSKRRIHLLLIGIGPEFERLSSLHKDNELLHFLGFKKNIRDYFSMSDAGFLPSKFQGESAPLVLVDCLLSGRPMLVSDLGEVREMLSSENGLAGMLIPVSDWSIDTNQLKDLIVKISSDRVAYNSALVNVKAAASKFSIDEMVDSYELVYADALSRSIAKIH